MFRVVITDCLPSPAGIEEEILSGLATVECWEARSSAALKGRLAEIDAVILYHEVSLSRELIGEMERCRIIARGGVGYDNVDLAAAKERGIVVTNVPDYGVDEVADHAIGLMLALRRGIVVAQGRLRRGLDPWDRRAVEPVHRLAGQTLGIIGCGRIGAATARRAQALRMGVTIYDPYLRPGLEKSLDVRRVHHLEALLRESDVVSLHAPLTDETRSMIDAAALRQMKPGAILINTARGEMVDTTALAAALESGQLAGAGIDVLPSEPATNADALVRLWQSADPAFPRLILTPHTAYYSEEGLEEIRRSTAAEVARVLSGDNPVNQVFPGVIWTRSTDRGWEGDRGS